MKTDSIRNLVKFILTNKQDWEEKLSQPPYCVKTKRHPTTKELVMFSYNQFDSDFYNPIVRVCRGSVLWIDDCNENNFCFPVLVPFYKFGNFNEGYADKIDWRNVRVWKKLDGSLIKVARHDNMNPRFLWTTNNSFDIDTEVPDCIPCFDEEKSRGAKTFHQLINIGLNGDRGWLENIPNGWTLMFELISPRNRVIVPYNETKLVLLGGRDSYFNEKSPHLIKTITRCPLEIPDELQLKSLEAVMNYCDSIKTSAEEGVVVCDDEYQRIKVKCEFYKSLKFLKGEDHFSDRGIFEAIKDNSIDDAISAWPEITQRVDEIKQEWKDASELIEIIRLIIKSKEFLTRKEYAEWVKKQDPVISSLLFECLKDAKNFNFYDKMLKYDYKEFVDYLAHLQAFFLEN